MIYFLVPVYNESANLYELAKNLTSALPNEEKYFVFVDDKSTDDTVEVITHHFISERLEIIEKTKNGGPGDSFNLGMNWIIENSTNPKDLVVTVEGDNLGAYVHSARIGVIAILQGGDEELAKDIAMHVAASSPLFVKPEDVPAEVVAKEIQLDIALQSGKPPEIAEKMVSGRMKKFTGEISLTGQPFVKDPSILVADLLKSKGADVINFVRFEVGEGIEKKEEDFAAEVAAQMEAVKK